MITAEELNRISKKYREEGESAIIKCILLSILLLVVAFFLDYLLSEKFELDKIFNIIFWFIIAVMLVLWFLTFYYLEHFFKRNSGYHCPNCEMQLAGKERFVIPTGNCSFCGKQAIYKNKEHSISSIAETGQIDLDELLLVVKKSEKLQKQILTFGAAIPAIILFIIGLILAFWFKITSGSQEIFDKIFCISFFIADGVFFIGIISMLIYLDRRSDYHCPYCKKQLLSKKDFLIASGNCPFCGKRVLIKEE